MAKQYSQNGYVAKDTSLIASYTVPGTKIRVNLRRGDVSVVLLYLLAQYHKTVEPLRESDTGSYNPRSMIGGTTLSNHASGTAVDVRWRDHPMGKRGTFTRKQVAAVRRILAHLDGVVRWGEDYKSRADGMHFEIVGSPERVAKVADKLRKPKPQVTPASIGLLQLGDKGSDIKNIQRDLNRIFPDYKATPLKVDGVFGPATESAVKEFQSRVGLKADGIIGSKTRAEFRKYGVSVRG